MTKAITVLSILFLTAACGSSQHTDPVECGGRHTVTTPEAGAGGEGVRITDSLGGAGGEPDSPSEGGASEGGAAAGAQTGGQPDGLAGSGGEGGSPEPQACVSTVRNPDELCESVTIEAGRPVLGHAWSASEQYCLGDRVVGFLPGQEAGCKTHVFVCAGAECNLYGPSSQENLDSIGEGSAVTSGTWRQLPDAQLGAVQCTSQGIGVCLSCGPEGC